MRLETTAFSEFLSPPIYSVARVSLIIMTIITGAVSDLLVGSPQLHCVISAVLVALFEFLCLCPISRPSTDRSANTKYMCSI